MTGSDYAKVVNLTCAHAAQQVLRGMLSGPEYGIDADTLRALRVNLGKIIDQIQDSIEVNEESDTAVAQSVRAPSVAG